MSKACLFHTVADRVEVADAIVAAVGRSEIGTVAAAPFDDFDNKTIASISVGEVDSAGKLNGCAVNEFGFALCLGRAQVEALLPPLRGVIPVDGWIGMAQR
jgi:hypothetical protein